jgi:hypothetical protein
VKEAAAEARFLGSLFTSLTGDKNSQEKIILVGYQILLFCGTLHLNIYTLLWRSRQQKVKHQGLPLLTARMNFRSLITCNVLI